ncbi:MAG TPA: hypothetical protein VIS99_10740 [Terrimicrobiaceae bacterium]
MKPMNGYVVTVLGLIVVAVGTFIGVYGQVLLRKADAEKARKEREIESQAVSSKLLAVMAALGAAKKEDSVKLTEAKIGMIQDDLEQWAANFVRTRPEMQKHFQAERLKVAKAEIQKTEEARPIFTFVLRFVEETAKAYSAKSEEPIEITTLDLPNNFYDTNLQTTTILRFKDGSLWTAYLSAARPVDDGPSLGLAFDLRSKDGTGGMVRIRPWVREQKLIIDKTGVLPIPNLKAEAEESELESYEKTIRHVFGRLLEAQILTSE